MAHVQSSDEVVVSSVLETLLADLAAGKIGTYQTSLVRQRENLNRTSH
jgi:hypothetical protein